MNGNNENEQIEQYNWGFEDLHEVLLKTLVYIHDFCKGNDIEYCLAYGSVLGAIRHHGFIPWDDDADIYMTLDNYRKFRQAFKDKGSDKYYFQELKSIDGMVEGAKLRVNNTTCLEESDVNLDMHQGIYVDIFILFPVRTTIFGKLKMRIAGDYLTIKKLSNERYNMRRLFIPILAFLRLFPENFLRKEALAVLHGGTYVGEFYDIIARKYGRYFWKKEILFPPKIVSFGTREFCVPNNPEEYLQQLYGDWRKIPDMASIKRAQHAVLIKTDEDFRNYVKNIKTFKDEQI